MGRGEWVCKNLMEVFCEVIDVLEEKMKAIEELKILTGMGKPNVQYVQEAIGISNAQLQILYRKREQLPTDTDLASLEMKTLMAMTREGSRSSAILIDDMMNGSRQYRSEASSERTSVGRKIEREERRLEKLQGIAKKYSS